MTRHAPATLEVPGPEIVPEPAPEPVPEPVPDPVPDPVPGPEIVPEPYPPQGKIYPQVASQDRRRSRPGTPSGRV